MPENKNTAPEGHRRRAHYSGKYPRRFEEKYKEKNPEKYAGISEHIIEKGGTPAGTHIPIMVNEILDVLKIKPGENGMDATLGYGGHTTEFLKALDHTGHLWSTDIDPIESVKTEARVRAKGYDESCWSVRRMNFRDIDRLTEESGLFDFLLADLGVSSMQIDDPSRGFSYKTDSPLDLRMDPMHGISAADRLRELEEDEIEGMLVENADEPHADLIASAIVRAEKKDGGIQTTTDLRTLIERVYLRFPEEDAKKACARVFQALRIDVNQEFEVLYDFLEKLPAATKSGARIAILTFHSGEDRLVKKAFRQGLKEGVYSEVCEDVIRPSKEECFRNPRAKSTKLRWAIRS